MKPAPRCLVLLFALGCAQGGDALSYRLLHSGSHWDSGEGGPRIESLRAVYPEYFKVILDPGDTRDPDLRPLRDDMEREPVDERNFAALHAIAIGYFELNYRAGQDPGGPHYFADNFRAAKLLAVPWRAYGETGSPALRDAILDFFEDAGSGEKLGTLATAPRLAPVVADLERKEEDPGRRERIRSLSEALRVPESGPEF